MTIGEKIKKTRVEKGLTQKELANRLNSSYVMVNQYENGKRNPKLETIKKIAKALDVDYLEFIASDKYARLLDKSVETMMSYSSYACPYELGYFKKECEHCVIADGKERKCWKEYLEDN